MVVDFARNPIAWHKYDILETLEAGLLLRGHEVKSIKSGKASIRGAYVKIISGKPKLIGAVIPPYQPNNTHADYQERADRDLLLTTRELSSLIGLQESHGITLVPIRLYAKKSVIKLEIGIARGRKKHDKREAIKKKDIARSRQRGNTEY